MKQMFLKLWAGREYVTTVAASASQPWRCEPPELQQEGELEEVLLNP